MERKTFKVDGTLEAANIDAAFYVLALHFLRLLVDDERVGIAHLLGDDAGFVSKIDVVPL